ncbi:hypothetical protein F4806DRAFT_446067 [Annulohypoxylon nitens]|nr:hypothetical protein F4806DRAFT_446067 [Annulohypoxylon nitens]
MTAPADWVILNLVFAYIHTDITSIVAVCMVCMYLPLTYEGIRISEILSTSCPYRVNLAVWQPQLFSPSIHLHIYSPPTILGPRYPTLWDMVECMIASVGIYLVYNLTIPTCLGPRYTLNYRER